MDLHVCRRCSCRWVRCCHQTHRLPAAGRRQVAGAVLPAVWCGPPSVCSAQARQRHTPCLHACHQAACACAAHGAHQFCTLGTPAPRPHASWGTRTPSLCMYASCCTAADAALRVFCTPALDVSSRGMRLRQRLCSELRAVVARMRGLVCGGDRRRVCARAAASALPAVTPVPTVANTLCFTSHTTLLVPKPARRSQ
jgi:hypothetical protein